MAECFIGMRVRKHKARGTWATSRLAVEANLGVATIDPGPAVGNIVTLASDEHVVAPATAKDVVTALAIQTDPISSS